MKTNYIAFHINRATEPKFDDLKIHRNGYRVGSIKYLGVYIDQNLSFEQHIIALSKRVRKFIFLMKTLRSAATMEIRKLVHPSLCKALLQ